MNETGYVEHYRANLTEAKAALAKASDKMRNLERNGFVVWGKIERKGLPDYNGWLVKGGAGGAADDAFAVWARAISDVDHWHLRLVEETKNPTQGVERDESRLRRLYEKYMRGDREPGSDDDLPSTLVINEEEKSARVREIQEQVAMRLGERKEDDNDW